MTRIEGTIIDLHARRQFQGAVSFVDGRIASVVEDPSVTTAQWIMPGYVDAHVHVESSMLVPSEFARLAVVHGTVGTVSDPHEIGNVCGVDGVRYMLDNGQGVPFRFAFGAPSCVPATPFETAGAAITAADIEALFADDRVRYLSEMMNWPGVLHEDSDVMQKLAIAAAHGRVVDGHAPGLRGADAARYASFGISTDHECFSLDEALDKIQAGMKILIREGSAARNFEALHPLLGLHPDRVMLCSDDMHPDSLVLGHINLLVRRALDLGYDLYDVLRAACINPVEHYGLPVGLLRVGDAADCIVTAPGNPSHVLATFIGGECVAMNGSSHVKRTPPASINRFDCSPITEQDLAIDMADRAVRVIEAYDGQLITGERIAKVGDDDVLKLVVVNRYHAAPPAIAFIHGMGLRSGALASSVAHDSHNIVAVGTADADLVQAINAVIACKGGISVAYNGRVDVLPLPVAGLMSDADGYDVAHTYATLDHRAKELGSTLRAPFMTLSFMALLVIPNLKLSDKGLFDGRRFVFTSMFAA